MEELEIVFEYEKATKNTYRYTEKAESGKGTRIGSLYVQKWALGEDPPKVLRVTISAGEIGGRQENPEL